MKLGYLTPANLFEIKSPQWGRHSIGIATHRVGNHNEIRITATSKDGRRLYPENYYISGAKAKTYPVEPVPSYPSIKLHIIPINDLETLERK